MTASLLPPVHSATLAVNELVQARRAAGRDVVHLGFGEAGLPVPSALTSVLAEAAPDNRYAPTQGSAAARDTAAGWFSRRGLPTYEDQIIFGPGSKPLLLALIACLPGPVVLPRPAWVSYAAQAALLGRRVISVPIPQQCGGVPDPDLLEATLRDADNPGGVLIITVPDNPTGTVCPPELLRQVCAVAERHGLTVVCDEIYAELCHEGSADSAVHYLPERTVITSGLSKSLALGGWRIGFARVPGNTWGRELMRGLTGVASEVWSSLAAPMQHVASAALRDPPEVIDFVAESRRLHARVAAELYQRCIKAGASCRRPRAAFYLYPDFGALRAPLAARGVTTSTELARFLLETADIATLPGTAFGDDDAALTLRLATSQLYGTSTDERAAALTSDSPETLPWIRQGLQRIELGLAQLAL